MIKNLVFDIGGIIIDDSDKLLKGYLGLSSNEFNELNRTIYGDVRWGNKVMLGYMSQEEYAKELTSEHPRQRNEIEKCLLSKYQPEVVPILHKNLNYIRDLKKTDKYKMYVLSNLTETTYHYLEEYLQVFDGGIYSFQTHTKKPGPQIYRTLFQTYSLKPEECLFFDDRKRNIEASESLGMRGIVVSSLEDIKSVCLL